MTAKEYLNRARGIGQEIEQLRRMRRAAYERATSCTAAPSQAPAHGVGGDVLAAYAGYQEEIDAKVAELLRVQRETEQVIARVPDDRYRALLRARYLEGMTWERIAVDMNYSYMQVCRLHSRALTEIEIILDRK